MAVIPSGAAAPDRPRHESMAASRGILTFGSENTRVAIDRL